MALVTSYWSLDGTLLLTTLIVTAYLYMTRNFNYWKKRGVLEISPVPFTGNFTKCMLMQKSPGYFMRDLYNYAKGSPYIGFYIFDRPCLLVRDRELIKNVLVKDFNYFFDRCATPDTKDRLGYANLFFLKNPAWKFLRTKLTPIFTSGKLRKMFKLMLECGNNLDVYINSLELEDSSKILEIKELVAKFTTDVIGSTAYGLNVNSLNNPDSEFRKYGKKIFPCNLIRGFEVLVLFFMPNLVRLTGIKLFGKEGTDFLRKTFLNTMLQRIESGKKRNDLIDALIELKKTHSGQDIGGFKFDGNDLIAQAAVFFTAGFEPSSSVTAFTLYELAIHPEIQTRVRKEIIKALDKSSGNISYDMILSLPYLDMVVLETLRKYPALSFLERMTMETYKVPNSDLVIEKGTPVYISMLGMHHDPEFFPDPEKYDPERFNEENRRNIPAYVYFPFGEGPRICIGKRFGLLTTKLALIKIFSKCEVTPCEKTIIPMILDPKASFALPLGGQIYLNVQKISAN